jgi:hypothetical protein
MTLFKLDRRGAAMIQRTPRDLALADLLLRKMRIVSGAHGAERQDAQAEAAYRDWRRRTLG